MKSINPSSRISKRINSENDEMNNLERGITKQLLEKYKPKVISKIETLGEKKDQRRVA